MFGALLLESSAGISLKHTKKIIQTLNSIDKNKQNTHSEPFLGRQTEGTKDTSVRKSARPAGVVVVRTRKITQNYFFRTIPRANG